MAPTLIPEDELASVVDGLKHVYSHKPMENIGAELKKNLQSLIDRLLLTPNLLNRAHARHFYQAY